MHILGENHVEVCPPILEQARNIQELGFRFRVRKDFFGGFLQLTCASDMFIISVTTSMRQCAITHCCQSKRSCSQDSTYSFRMCIEIRRDESENVSGMF